MSSKKKKSTVRANIGKNRLYVSLAESISKEDIDSIYTEIRFCVSDLSSGFDVITDLTNAKLGHLIGVNVFRKIAQFLQNQGVNRIIRVTPQKSIIAKQLAHLSAKIPGYSVEYKSSIEEAEELLDSQSGMAPEQKSAAGGV
ncbi:MAG: hypothetical protein D6B25_17275 [Desulfobulbaceae bacterium]|nr:MAG: hypothetical protein D6B25_17275 [Desulfobulbaceae bacterium]